MPAVQPQALDPDADMNPLGQSKQSVEPAELEYLPGGHGAYVEAPARTNEPAALTGWGYSYHDIPESDEKNIRPQPFEAPTIFAAVGLDANATQLCAPADALSTQVKPESSEVYIYPPCTDATILVAELSLVKAYQ